MYVCTFRVLNHKYHIMKKLYPILALFMCVMLPFSAISQNNNEKKEKKKKEHKEVNPNFKHKFTTFHLEARAAFEYDYDVTKWSNFTNPLNPVTGKAEQHGYGFHGDYFNFLLGGDIGDHISYFIRQRIIPHGGSVNFFDNTDYLYIQYKFNDQWSLRMGKEALFVGGFEYDAPPIDVYYYTHYWGAFPCFHLGVSAAYTDKSGKNKVIFQVANSPYTKYVTNDWKKGLFAYSIYWNGNFGPFSTTYSVNMMEYQRGKFINYIALGNRLKFQKWSIYFDYINRAAGFDKFFNDFSLVSRIDWQVSPSVNLFAKGGYEQNTSGYYYTVNNTDVDVDMLMPNQRNYCFYGLGMEYRPLVYPDLRVHAYVANSVMALPSVYDADGSWKNQILTANVGVTWWLNFMKFLPEKLK